MESGAAGECSVPRLDGAPRPSRACSNGTGWESGSTLFDMREPPAKPRHGRLSSQRARDRGDVVIEHAEVSAFVGAFRPHGIGEQLAADLQVLAARLRPANQ